MRALFRGIGIILIIAGAAAGCGESGPGSGVLTTVEVTPAAATLFTVAPENTVELSVVAKDEEGAVMAGGSPSFTSDAQAVATVSNDGIVSAASAGTARITTSLTVDGVTRTATTTVTVQEAPSGVTVTAPQLTFTPATVDVRSGGSVTWTMEDVPHTVDFTTVGAPTDLPELQNSSASRTFATGGSFSYRCTIHPSMTGVVRVH